MNPGPVTRTKAMTTIRASSLGSCERELVLAWMGIAGGDRPKTLQGAMDVSAGLEDVLLDILVERGYRVSDRQMEVVLDVGEKVRVVGHLDGLARKDRKSYVAEVKAFGDELYTAAIADVASWSESYAYQVSAYMHATGLPCVFLVGHKKAGENGAVVIDDVKLWEITTPPVPLDAIREKVGQIADAAARLSKPRQVPCTSRWGCPLFSMGYCDGKVEEPVVRDLEVEEWAATYDTARGQKKLAEVQMEEARGELVRLLGDRDKMSVPGYGVSQSETKRREWDREAVALALKNCGHDPASFEVVRVSKRLDVRKRGE